MNATSPTLPGFGPDSPEAQVRKNLERAMHKYGGDIRAYFAKLLERAPERAGAENATHLELLAVRRRN
jgi:hypothetical protein